MLDDLHDLSDSSSFLDELVDEDVNKPSSRSKSGGGNNKRRKRSSSNSNQFLGMTAFQRFFISGMLFGMVLIGGFVLMVLLGKMGLPF